MTKSPASDEKSSACKVVVGWASSSSSFLSCTCCSFFPLKEVLLVSFAVAAAVGAGDGGMVVWTMTKPLGRGGNSRDFLTPAEVVVVVGVYSELKMLPVAAAGSATRSSSIGPKGTILPSFWLGEGRPESTWSA